MANKVPYKPDYLKVSKKRRADQVKDVREIVSLNFDMAHNPAMSKEVPGSLTELFRTVNYSVVEFIAHSVDLGRSRNDTIYATKGEALRAAIKYFDRAGYEAKVFDLEGMVDEI